MKLRDRVHTIATKVYGADGIDWLPDAEAKAKMIEAILSTMTIQR